MAIIEVNHVTKEYRLGQLASIKENVQNLIARVRGEPVPERKILKALDDVHFSVEPGEVLGIIGTNGAGKSTLLKLLSRISIPTQGSIQVRGTVAPLIEVGAGIIGDLTGRENIYLNGAILGIPRKEITRRFDDIVSFAELEDFVDTPVKRYSSGMKVRLGFAVATSVDPDILIVDEVLAVGDLAFQRKCFDRIEDLIKRKGKTILLVSHNIRQVERLCTRAILLDHGKILADGTPEEISNKFYQRSDEKILAYQKGQFGGKPRVQSSGEVEVQKVEILDATGQPTDSVESGEPLRIRVRFEAKRHLERPEIVVGTHRTDFIYLTSGSTAVYPDRPSFEQGVHEIEQIIPHYPMMPGTYCVRVVIFDHTSRMLFNGETLIMFNVTGDPRGRTQGTRMLDLPLKWQIADETFDWPLPPEEGKSQAAPKMEPDHRGLDSANKVKNSSYNG